MGEEIDERAGGRFYGIAVGIDSVRLDGSQVPGGKDADLAIKWRYRDPTRRITLDLPRSKTGKPASSTISCRPCTARATSRYSRGDVAHEPDLRSRHSGWARCRAPGNASGSPLGDRRVWFGSRLCENSNDRQQSINFSRFSAVFRHYKLGEAKKFASDATFSDNFPSFHTAWVTGGCRRRVDGTAGLP